MVMFDNYSQFKGAFYMPLFIYFRFTCPEKFYFMPMLAFISAEYKHTIKCITSVLCKC